MSVRVVAGAARGRRLRVPPGGTRPTAALVREALFDMLAHRDWLAGRSIIDCYAGSGALGIEAASRGAARVVFVEEARPAARVLRENLRAVGVDETAEVLVMPVARALSTLARRGTLVDGVLADPPYDRGLVDRTLERILGSEVLRPGGWIAIEHSTGEMPRDIAGLALVVQRRYGSTVLSILRREEEEAHR